MAFANIAVIIASALATGSTSDIPKGGAAPPAISAPGPEGAGDDAEPGDPSFSRPAGSVLLPPVVAPVISPILPPPPPHTEPFQWRSASTQAAFFTAIMHAKRFIAEAGTRDALHGPFWTNYFDSVSELRGWDDGDGFHTSYIGHPMEGAVFAFIEVQNDPRYRSLIFNQNRDYWFSRLRAMAFSTVWSTLWTLGPVSEASLGNAELHSSPGVVDLVVTPTLGVGWAIGEDFIDRYLLTRLENHTANRFLLVLSRSFGNPTRAMANLMGGRRPWQRDTRPGLFGPAFVARSETIRSKGDLDLADTLLPASSSANRFLSASEAPPMLPKVAPIELQASAHYETFVGGGSCIGGGGQGAFRPSPSWQAVAEVSGCLIINQPVNESGDSLLYVAGPRWTPHAGRRVSPYAQILFGGRKVTHEIMDPQLRATLQKEWEAGLLPHYPKRSDYSVEDSENGFAIVAGGGMDINLNPALTLRLANLEYTRSFVPQVDRIDAAHGIRFTSGLVLRIGTW